MRAGRKRTLLSWTTYTKGEVEHAGDAREGLWSHAQLEAMDQKFCRAVELAFAGRVEQPATSTSARWPRLQRAGGGGS
jgi:hypothetical protein